MSPLAISIIVLAGTTLLATLGFSCQRLLPVSQHDEATRWSVRMSVGLMSTLTAIVLGMVTASAKGTYDRANGVVSGMAVDYLTLDRILDAYGPDAAGVRQELLKSVRGRIELMQSEDRYVAADERAVAAGSSIERLHHAVEALAPSSESQTDLRKRALDTIDSRLAQARWFFTVKPASIPRVFMVVVGLWLGLEAFSLGLFCHRNKTVYISIAIAAVVMSSAAFLLLELEDPLSGFLRVPIDPLHEVERLLNR